MSLTAAVLAIARTHVGEKETGNNSGPFIDNYLASVGLNPGYPWCAAALFYWFREAAQQLGLENPFPKTASSLRVWTLSEPICRVPVPTPGCVYVLQHSPSTGHVGIVESIGEDGVICEISANTFDGHGGREGNTVAKHYGDPAVTHGGHVVGWLDFDEAAQPPNIA